MAIINIGVLIISVKKYWKPLYYSSFILTWIIFSFWYITDFQADAHYAIFWVFVFVFFMTFYLIFISYKLLHQEKFQASDVLLILSNSFIFYGLGYSVLVNDPGGVRAGCCGGRNNGSQAPNRFVFNDRRNSYAWQTDDDFNGGGDIHSGCRRAVCGWE